MPSSPGERPPVNAAILPTSIAGARTASRLCQTVKKEPAKNWARSVNWSSPTMLPLRTFA
eukprot:2365570-Lingulodinium_polyedra.AAC.1